MKNKIYYFGIICCLLVLAGCLFKIFHWPGAGILITLSFTLFSLVFIPVALTNNYRTEKNGKLKWLYIIAFVSILIETTGALFKIQHWPGADVLMIVAIPLPFVLFLPAYLIHVSRNKQLNYNNILLVLFFFAYFGAISALLSVNISKNLIDDSILATYNLEQNVKVTNDQTHALIEGISKNSASDSVKQSLQYVKEKSDKIYTKIDNLKVGILKLVSSDNQLCITEVNKIDLWKINGKDKFLDIKGVFENDLKELETYIDEYTIFLLSGIKGDNLETISYIKHLLNTKEVPWKGDKNIFGMQIIFIIQSLELLKKDIALATYEAVSAVEEGS